MGNRIIKWIAVVCFLACLLSCLPLVHADARTIRVGYYMFAGYQEEDADGNHSGYGYDFLQEMARYTGWDYEYVGYDLGWAKLQQMLDNGEIDILTSARKTPDREGKYLFSTGIGTSAGILTVKSGDTRLTMGEYATYDGIRVGVIKDSSINDNFRRFAAAKGFTYTPVEYLNADDMNADLQNGTNIDAVCTTNLRHVQNEWILDQFDTDDFYVMMNVKDTALQQEVDQAIEQMDRYSPGWRTALWNRYYRPDMGNEIAFNSAEKAYIRELNEQGVVLTVICRPDNAPFSYFEEGTAKGIIPQLFAEIARRTGLPFKIIETQDNDAYQQAIRDGSIDVRMDTYGNYNSVEKSGYRMTIPYLSTPLAQVTLKSLQQAPQSAAVTKGLDSLVPYADILKNQTIAKTFYPTGIECVQAVLDGRMDVAFVSPYTVQQFLNGSDRARLTMAMLPQGNVDFALAVANKNDPRLLAVLNKAAYSVKSNYTDEVALNYMAKGPDQVTVSEFFETHPLAKWAGIITIVVILGALSFIINRQRTLRMFRDKNEQLRLAVEKATEANAAKSQFLSNISHDMRTPLNGIIGFTNFAIASTDADKKQQNLLKVRQSSSILLNLINDTLELSRIESGKLKLIPEVASLHELIDDVVVVIQAAADKRQITFTKDINVPESVYVKTDRLKTQEIFLNLLSNAVKYTPCNGHVQLIVQQGESTDTTVDCRIIVADDGIGISKEFLPKIYDSFTQENRMEMSHVTGTGLGLAIVKRIIMLMHGSIGVESELGKGTTFTVDLPMELALPGEVQAAVSTVVSHADNLAGKKILLCEDNEINAEIARTLLENKNAHVVWTTDGAKGLAAFQASQVHEFSAILMDVHMPVMDGYTATKAIRDLPRADAKTIPIIAMTADAYDEDIRKCLAAGMNAHVAKPVEPDKLFRVMEDEIGGRS